MKPKSYWQKRIEQLSARQFKAADGYESALRKEYQRAQHSIQKDIEAFYGRFATNNQVSFGDARKLLTKGELAEFKKMTLQEFTNKAKNNADGRWTRELNNVYYKTRVSRLEALEVQINQHVEMLVASEQAAVKRLLGDAYTDTYYRSMYEIQRGTGIGASFAKVDDRTLEKVLGARLDGRNWSQRIWDDRTKLRQELHTKLTQGFIRGDSVDRMSRELAKRMDVSYNRAKTLVQTETAFFTEQAAMASYKESGILDQYENLVTLDDRTCPICAPLDGKVFRLSEMDVGVNYPPFHPNCRCTTIPYFDDEIDPGERFARDSEGQSYYVPGDITYEQWRADYVDSPKPPESAIINTNSYRRFATPSQAEEWEQLVTPPWLEKLTVEEKSSINYYTGPAYKRINNSLRGIDPNPDFDSTINRISDGLRKFDLQEDIILHRGWNDDLFGVPIEKLKGVEFSDPAFLSTSLIREKAEDFSRKYIAEVRVPKGTSGAMIRPLSEFSHEYEFLLDKGTALRILEAEERSGRIELIMEVIRDGAK